MSVLDAKSCGAETAPELVTSPQTTLPIDTPPLVAVKVQSRLLQSSGPAEATPVIVSVAPMTAPPRLLRLRYCLDALASFTQMEVFWQASDGP